jgi:hypothetical protein
VNVADRDRWAATLGTAGWLFLVAWLALLVTQLRRAAILKSSPFEDGVWGQRAEIVSFVTLPQNLVVLVPAVACAALAAALTSPHPEMQSIWRTRLNRFAAGACYVAIALATFGILDVFAQNPDSDGAVAAVLPRAAGVLMAVGMVRVCLLVERQTPSSPRL